jgi:hypothetical protein
MDATQSRPWQAFLSELHRQGIEFEMVRSADEASRTELLQALQGLTAIDRAVISSTWAKLAQQGAAGPPGPVVPGAAPAPAPPAVPVVGVPAL